MKQLLVFVFLVLFAMAAFAQTTRIPCSINWQEYGAVQQSNQTTTHYLHFENAIYPGSEKLWPYFYNILPLTTGNETVEVKITDAVYEEIAANELNKLSGNTDFPANIEISQVVYYQQKKPYLEIQILPLRTQPQSGKTERLTHFTLEVKLRRNTGFSNRNTRTYAENSVLKTGNWHKIAIPESGLYKITYTELQNMGITQPQQVRMFGYGGLLSIYNDDETFDDLPEIKLLNDGEAIYFYAQGPDEWSYNSDRDMFLKELHWYSYFSHYFITDSYDTGMQNQVEIAENLSQQPTNYVESYLAWQHHESEIENFLESGRNWYGESFDIETSQDYAFQFRHLIPDSEVKLRVALIGRSNQVNSFTASNAAMTQTIMIFPIVYSNKELFAQEGFGTYTFDAYQTDTVSVNITYNKPVASAEGWLDYITVNAECELKMDNNLLFFNYFEHESEEEVSQFTISGATENTVVWDITNAQNVVKMPTEYNNNQLIFKTLTDTTLRQFVAFETTAFEEISATHFAIEPVENQNLHAIGEPDMIIVTPAKLHAQAGVLGQHHRQFDNLTVEVVDVEKIYNEFSSGTVDAAAIRNFMKMLYDRAETPGDLPQYLLLFGDGSYDNKSISVDEISNTNLLPTYQSNNSLRPTATFCTDDFFGLLDAGEGAAQGYLDIGIGRLPLNNSEEAASVVSKIIDYATNPEMQGNWRQNVCFMADDGDDNAHIEDADNLAVKVDTTFLPINLEKIYFDAFQKISTSAGSRYPDANAALNRIVEEKGALIVNYLGHGSEVSLGNEHVLDLDDVLSWTNYTQLPLFMTATCEFSRFDTYKLTSAGEYLLFNESGGAIALFSTTRLVYATPNFVLNDKFYNYIFATDTLTNAHYRLGDVMRLTKIASGNSYNKRNFTLLGDPALRLAIPENQCITTQLNGVDISETADTVRAMTKVTISGSVLKDNELMTNFEGFLYPVVYDKSYETTTFGNAGDPEFTFTEQNILLFKGKVSINNGQFSFSFIVPKDVIQRSGLGKISYYASNETTDAFGNYENFWLLPSDSTAIVDNEGPAIKLFMNDESFIFGGFTDHSPLFIAELNDSSGVNFVNTGIGHEMRAIFDNNLNEPIYLTDFYENDLDSYQSGKIEYQFSDLEEGTHEIELKVWDVFNNPSHEKLEFIVLNSSELIIEEVFNYPNPFTQTTSFYFKHNQPDTQLEVTIQIFTVSGKLIKTIHTVFNSPSELSQPIPWDGTDDFGDPIGRGAYIYRLRVEQPGSNSVEKIEKLVILK